MRPLDALAAPLTGVNLIEASAGTGKTYTITILYLRLVLEMGLSVENILAVTFTTAATEELKGRIRGQLRRALDILEGAAFDEKEAVLFELVRRTDSGLARKRLMAALRDFDIAAVFTIHGFCQRMLSDMAFETHALFDARLIEDQAEYLTRFADDFWRTHIQGLPLALQDKVLKEKLFPENLLTLIKAVGTDAEVVPDIPRPDVEAVLAQGSQAFARARKCWDLPAVRQALQDARLHGSRYPASKVQFWLRDMDTYLRSGECFPIAEACLRFKHSRLVGACTKQSNAAALAHPFFDACEELAGCDTVLGEYLTWLKSEFVRAYRAEFQRLKERQGLMHFDDLLLKLRQALAGPGADTLVAAVRARFKAALIDEFQDTDPLQYAIFGRLFELGPLFLIGDPKQAIYSFRGADFETYLLAARGIDPGHAYTLTTNWRSVAGLISAFNTLFTRASNPFACPEVRYYPVAPAPKAESGIPQPLIIWLLKSPVGAGDANDQAIQAVGAEIVRLMREEGRPPKDMAVLTRTNRQASLARDLLSDLGIPCVLFSDRSVFTSNEAFEIEVLLNAVAMPQRQDYIRACLATDLFSWSAGQISALDADERAWDEVMERFRHYHELWIGYGFMRMFTELLAREEIPSRLVRLKRGERRITNLMHLAELLHLAGREAGLGVEALLAWLNLRRREEEAAYELRLESDADAVRIVTVHKSKGLEYPIVFCPFAWSTSVLHKPYAYHADGRRMVHLKADKDSPEKRAAEQEHLAEDMRLLYVALTRSRERCYVVWGKIDKADRSPLNYLLHEGRVLKDRSVEDLRAEIFTRIQGEDHIAVSAPPALDSLPPVKPAPAALFPPRVFTAAIDRTFRISSFTALTSAAPATDAHDHDTGRVSTLNEEALPSIFSLPRGARTGIMLHELMERIDFTDPSTIEPVLGSLLPGHGFQPVWLGPILGMAQTVLDAPLDCEGLRLSSIPLSARLTELEFHLPLAGITPQSLGQAFAAASEIPPGFPQSLSRLEFDVQQGFVRGFIDLVFECKGRYYLIDWKSNHLGDQPEDYHAEALEQEMLHSYYILQYHLYCLALHRYLKRRIPDYDYDRHFGAVFYVFLRGVDAKGATGIYRARPSLATIETLEKTLIGEDP